MARLVLTTTDGFTFEVRPNEMETLDMTATPVMDPSGMEVLYHKVRLDVRAVINPLMLATNQPTAAPAVVPPPGAPPPAGLTFATGPGDRAGLTARAVMQLLGNPRPLVQYWIGPDLVLEAPERLDDAGTQFALCDPMGGPFVVHCRCYELRGDRTMFLNLSIELATTAYSKILLSNRWRMTSEIDSAGFTTRSIDGVAVFRLDGLVQIDPVVPDDFRNLLLVPADASLRRIRASFTIDDDQRTYRYHVVDRETAYGTGATSGVEKIEGTVSAHVGTEIMSFKDLAKQQLSIAVNAANAGVIAAAPYAVAAEARLTAVGMLNKSFADARVSCSIRVLGQSGATIANIYNLAMQVFSRKVLTPATAGKYGFFLESFTVTQWIGSEDQPIVHVQANIVPRGAVPAAQIGSAAFAANLMDMSTGVPGPLNYNAATPRTQLPASNNTRGAYGSSIFAQLLTATSEDLPPAPAAPPIAFDMVAI